jgi:phosphoglycolate phosphatase-like HAD superfamily hydrolase
MTKNVAQAWDSYHAYLFDIDGTLLNCTDAVHYFAFCDALQDVTGQLLTLEGVTTHGNTDVGILRDAFERAAIPDADWRPHLPHIKRKMCEFVENRKADLRVTRLPQVNEVLGHLHAKRAVLGIATGNLAGIGQLKLQACGVLNYFDVFGWSDEFEYRKDVIKAAVALLQGATHSAASICVVGDTPADIRAARANSLDVIAVATGVYSYDCLVSEAPDFCLHSFEDLL